MSSRSPARWLGPAALAAALLAVVVLVSGSLGGGDSEPSAGGTATEQRTDTQGRQDERADGEPGTDTEPERARTETTTDTSDETEDEPAEETYRVEPGDTLSTIAAETGVTIDELEELNPGVDSQSLTVGQELKLR